MSDSLNAPLERFEDIAGEVQTFTFLPRATELQAAACTRIQQFLEVLAENKTSCILRGDEECANTILAMELSLRTVLHEIQMWIDLKHDAPEAAWDHLVSAQYACEGAIAVRRQMGTDSAGPENLLNKLLIIERFVFPPQVFNSVGGTARRRDCSICGDSYDDCGHIKGRAYMGTICHTIVCEMDLQEVSIVTDPADKRCRITHFSDQGKMRNKMTWRLEDR
mgnify:CR=1 FL=1